jgi:DNA-binding transcriptional LysR family regulator
MPAFHEELVVLAPRSHPRVWRARDVRADSIISFPSGCAYRRRLQSWLAAEGIVPEKILELSSYHAIIACVASGTGIAVAPRSVLETVRGAESVSIYPLAARTARVMTSLVWRKGESSPSVTALQAEIAQFAKTRPRRGSNGPARRGA